MVNLVAVPLVSVLMVPLGLAGWLLAWVPPLSMACWTLFAGLTQGWPLFWKLPWRCCRSGNRRRSSAGHWLSVWA
nr:hypothetical protein [Halomonas elongata]